MIQEFIPGCFDAAKAELEGTGPVEIVHLFRFREEAFYEHGTDLPLVSGKEAFFQRYLPAINELAAKYVPGGKLARIIYAGEFKARFASPEDEFWDYIIVVQWPGAEYPYILDTHPEYETAAAHHRRAALQDFRVLVSQQVAVAGV